MSMHPSTSNCSSRKKVSWFNEDIAAAIRERMRLEHAWYRDKSKMPLSASNDTEG